MDPLAAVHSAYLALGDLHNAGKALIGRATYLGHEGDPERAERLLAEALELIDPEREPAVAGIALHSRIWFLAAAGRHREARSLLFRSRDALEALAGAGQLNQAKIAHLEGYINSGLGEYERAERALRAGMDLLASPEVEAHRGLIALDLVVVWMQQGRLEEARLLAAETSQRLLAQGLPGEAEKALRLMRRAFDQQWASVLLVQTVVDFLRAVPHLPNARFELAGL